MIGSYSWRNGPLCSLRAGTCAQPLGGAGFWFGVVLVAVAAWNLSRGTRPGGVYRWMFPNGNPARSYGPFVAVNMILLAAGIALVLSPFVRR